MALRLKDGSIFLHIPKPGGNWVTDVLYRENLVSQTIGGHKHVDLPHLFSGIGDSPWDQFRNWIGNIPVRSRVSLDWARGGKPFIFCFVRHPASWYESWFKYMNQESKQWRDYGNEHTLSDWHPNAVLNGTGSTDFNQFIQNVIDKRPGYVTELFNSYTAPGLVDYVGQQESLREDLIHALSQCNLDFNPDRIRNYSKVGVSKPKKKLTIEWDPRLRREVLDLEYATLVRHNYLNSNTP